MGCALAQGFLFAKPASAADSVRYLRVDPIDLLDANWQTDNALAETG